MAPASAVQRSSATTVFIIEVTIAGVPNNHATLDERSGFVAIDRDGQFVDDPTLAHGLLSSHRGALFAMSVDPDQPAWLEDGALLAGQWTELVMPLALRVGSATVTIRELVKRACAGGTASEDGPTLTGAQLVTPPAEEHPSAPWPRSERVHALETTRVREIVVPIAHMPTLATDEAPATIRTPFPFPFALDEDDQTPPLVITRTSPRSSWERIVASALVSTQPGDQAGR